jgi:hypothetical protein
MYYMKSGRMYLCRVREEDKATYGEYLWCRPPTLHTVAVMTRESLEKEFHINPDSETDYPHPTNIVQRHCRAKHGELVMERIDPLTTKHQL